MSIQTLPRRLALAFQFLTVLRVRVAGPVTDDELRGSTFFYPLVGAALGGALVAAAWALAHALPSPVVVALGVVGLAALTGGLHLDGVADVCDGFYAGRTREDALRIMKDPHIGTMGVVGLICVLGLKYIALLNVPTDRVLWAIVAAPVVGRSVMVVACALGRYAREEGTGKAYIGQLGRSHALVAVAFAAAGCAMLREWKVAALAFALSAIWLVLFMRACNRRIGGLTGDTLGALCETTELIVWLAACADCCAA
ncbi:MAG: adenosylcobinamide-GDP ribazoletransferase [Verrucomicrobia bacterium]|nr:adenosylcobinamide-GDP ribazoletransferase [Verrucomicrobiota bacterium]